MAADAREQTASCDAFVLSRRLPAPGAPPCRKSPACLIARTRPSSYLLSPECHLPRMVPTASVTARCEPVPAFPLIPDPSTYPAWSSAASAAARCEPVPAFPLIPDPSTYPAWSSAASAAARCEPVPAFPLIPDPSTYPAWSSAASAAARCEPVPAFPLIPDPSTYPAWSSAASAAARCEPVPAFPLIPDPSTYPAWPAAASAAPGVSRFRRIGSYLRRVTRAPGPVLWQRTPGACAERGLVRTGSHQAELQKLSPRSRKAGLVRTGTEAFGSAKADSNPKLKEVADFCPAK